MSNLPKAIELELDKKRQLYVTLGAMYEFEQATGKDISQMEESISDILQFLSAAMKFHDPDVKIEDFMHYLHPGNMEDVMGKIKEAVGQVSNKVQSDQELRKVASESKGTKPKNK